MKTRFIATAHVMILVSFLGLVTMLRFGGVRGLSLAGSITTDTTWAFEDSPIEVTGDVTIENGATLSIEPGVVVKFEAGLSLTVIDGNLNAVGAQDNRTKFTSSDHEPSAGDWEGIKFEGDENSTFTMSFCDVEYAKDGVTITSLGKAVIEKSTFIHCSANGIYAVGTANLLIRDNTVALNPNGISASGVTSSGLKIIGNHIMNNENGVYLSVFGDDSRIHNVTIAGNSFRNNTNGIYLHSSSRPVSTASTYIHAVTISNNSIQSLNYGMHLLAKGWGEPGLVGGGAYIYNVTISQNNISFSEDAIYIDSSSNWYSWISDLTISGNRIHSSQDGIFMHAFRTPKPPLYPGIPFDALLVSNIVSANGKGVSVSGDVRANFTSNSISYNSYGISLDSSVPSESVARNNDIYQNTVCGLAVVEEASIDGEQNYWGASSGPYHATLNPDGEGDSAHGDEENLSFMPFLTKPYGKLNGRPLAVLKAGTTIVVVNQTIAFDGSESSDDSSIIGYFFDFGDGDASQVFPGVARHTYASPGTYDVSLVVMDDLGVNSTNRAIETIMVTAPPSLVVSVFLDPLNVFSEGQAEVEVHVEAQVGDELASIEGALIELTSDAGGSFTPSSGYTNSTGDFHSTFLAPHVEESILMTIMATGSKDGYTNASADAFLQVLTPSSNGAVPNPNLILLGGTFAIIVSVAVLVVLKRTGKLGVSHSKD